MDQKIMDFVIRITNEGLLLTIVICGPPIVLSMIVGLAISLFQAVTQLQEQTLTFVPKMIVIFGSLAIFGPLLGASLVRFTRVCFESFPRILY